MSLHALLSSRDVLKEYSGPDPKELSEHICKLISRSVDTTDLISDEVFSKFSDDLDLTPLIQHVEDVIRYRPSLGNYTVEELLECYILQSLDKCVKAGEVEALKNVISVVNKLKTDRKVTITVKDMNTENPEIAFLLYRAEILKIEELFGRSNKAFLQSLARDHCRTGTEVARELVRAAVKSESKVVAGELGRMVTLVLETLDSGWALDWLAGVGDKRWASSLLNSVIRHGAVAGARGLEEAVTRHLEWTEDPALGLGSLCSGLVVSLGVSDLVRLIFRALERGEPLNWRHVCGVIRVTCVTCPDASDKWLDLLKSLIAESLQEENSRRLILGLFLVRYVTFSVTTPGTCPSYLTWLNNNVDGEAGILCGNVKLSCQFLVTVLTKLVSLDPVPVLKAQLSARMSVLVRQSREGWEVYRQLARSRLDSLTSTAREKITSAPMSEKTRATVTSYVQEWARTGRMASGLTEDIMFRMPVFEAELLPGLLSVSLDTEELEVAREQLVTALHNKGKVPPGLFSK